MDGVILTIVTINRNNAEGLNKTLTSTGLQSCTRFEHVIIDGASTDESIEHIKSYAKSKGEGIKWISEPDNGIYNAMNKGISMASGEYIQFLNSGDCLASTNVVSNMLDELERLGHPSIMYGNMLKVFPNGKLKRDKCFEGNRITLLGMYKGCLNHSPTYIRKDLFSSYGPYDESLRICSDWKWFLEAIVLGHEEPMYVNIDVTIFDMTGISETQKELLEEERSSLLNKLIPNSILADYTKWYSDIKMIDRLKRYHIVYYCIHIIERCIFKLERVFSKK